MDRNMGNWIVEKGEDIIKEMEEIMERKGECKKRGMRIINKREIIRKNK